MFKHNHPQRKKTIPSRPPTMTREEVPQVTEEMTTVSESQSENEAGFSEDSETAPKQRRRRGPNKNGQSARQAGTIAQIEASLQTMIGMIVAATYYSGKPVLAKDGQVIAQHSKNLIDSILNLCKQDKNVREFFLALSTSSAYGAVIIATMPIVIGILANHNLIPPLFNTGAVSNGTNDEAVPNATN